MIFLNSIDANIFLSREICGEAENAASLHVHTPRSEQTSQSRTSKRSREQSSLSSDAELELETGSQGRSISSSRRTNDTSNSSRRSPTTSSDFSVGLPMQVPTDIRRSYGNMFANVLNSVDPMLLNNFLVDQCKQDCTMVNECGHARNLCLPSRMELHGVQLLFEFWHGRMTMFPDGVMNIIDSKVITVSTSKISKVVTTFRMIGTKCFDLSMEDWLPSLLKPLSISNNAGKDGNGSCGGGSGNGGDYFNKMQQERELHEKNAKYITKLLEDWPECGAKFNHSSALRRAKVDAEKEISQYTDALGGQQQLQYLGEFVQPVCNPNLLNVLGEMTMHVDEHKRIVALEMKSTALAK